MKGARVIATVSLLVTGACAHHSAASSYPLLDADCEEYPGLGAKVVDAAKDVTLFAFETDHFVYLCASLPEESLGTADLVLATPSLPSPINLHVSAQIGEWFVNDPDSAPQTADSDRWWRVEGWYAPTVRLNGFEETQNGRRPRFIPSAGREWQISKARFGAGEWRLKLTLNQVRGPDGATMSVTLPENGEATLAVR